MAKFDLKLWGIKLRKVVIASLILPFFTTITVVTSTPAYAVPHSASGGSCTQDVGSTTGVTVTVNGRDCIVTFTNTTANSWVVPSNGTNFQILVVGGGGGGGADGGNGGGGGELRYSSGSPAWIPAAGTTLSIQVGAGGAPASNGTASTVAWGGTTRYQANPGAGGGGWQSMTVPLGGTGGTGGTGTNGQNATAVPPTNSCTASISATQQASGSNWWSSRWFMNGGGGAGGALTTTAPSNSISGDWKFYGGAGGAGWGSNINSASVGPIYGLAGGGTVFNTSTSGGRGANWRYEAGESTSSRAGASVGGNGVNGTGGGGGAGNACDPTISGAAVENLVYKRTSGGSGGTGSVTIRYTSVFTVTFDVNNGTGSPSATSASQTLASSTVTLASAGTLTRSGFRFSGWNTSANGTGTSYAPGASFVPTNDITLFAQWSSTISYGGNTATSTRAIESNTVIGTAATSTLSQGRLVRGTPISDGLVLNLDAADSSTVSASTWTNKVSGGTSATIVGSPTYSASEGAFTLNGSSQYFDLGDSAFNFTGTRNYTINVAFKNNEPMRDSTFFARYNGGVAGNYVLRAGSGKFLVQREVSPWEVYSNSYIDPSQINYISAVYNGSTLSVYVNGVADGSIAMTGTVYASTIKTLIGARLNSGSVTSHLNGKIYSVQVYNRALSASEIATNYQALIPENRVSKNNFTLAGWSTSPSSGTVVAGSSTALTVLPTPYLRLLPANYNASSKVWTATNGSGAGFTYTGTPVYNATGGGSFGATKTFPTISGATNAGIRLNNPTLKTYTLCVVARYKDVSGLAGSQGRLINSSNSNWFSGFYNGKIQQFHHEAWNYEGPTTDLNWHYYCDSGNKAIWDGVKTPTWTYRDTTSLPPLAINWDYYGQNSNWELAEMIVYDQFLSDSAIDNLGRYFKNQYGIVAGAATSVAAGDIATVTDYASTGDATLHAIWGSKITYEGNGQTTGTPPGAQIITGDSGTLATNTGSLAKAGYKFAGWNTAANGSGTFYLPGATYPNTGNVILYAQYSKPLTFPTQYSYVDPLRLSPYMRFKASDYNASSKVWVDSSGNNRSTSTISGSPSVITTSLGKGNTKTFSVVSGTTAERIRFNNPIFYNGNYTLVTVARYSGANTSRIFDAVGYNWLHGFWSGSSGVAFHNGWVTASSSVVHGDNWLIGASFESNYRSNGVSRGSSGGVTYMPPMSINYGDYPDERSNFQVAEVLIFDYKLTPAQLAQVEDYLSQTYGIALASPGSYPASLSVAIGAGVGGRSETLTAVDGFSTKTFTTTPLRSGFSIDTSTANGVALVVSPTVASGTYSQNIIATDGLGDTATYLLNVTVNPSVKFDTSTATTVITTHRRGATLRLNTVFGVGTKVFTMTPAATGLTLDTSTAASGFATLRVDSFTAPGTYTQVITVTDDTRIRSTYTVTITINGPPTISSTSAITTSPVLDNLRLNLDAGDQASYSGSGSTWTDLSGNSRNATLFLSPVFSTANGGILDFNGSSHYATAPSVRSEVFTVEAWVKFDALNNNYACVVTNQYSSNKINYSICFWGNSTIRAGYHQAGTGWVGGTTGAFTPVVGTWYQLVYRVEKVGVNYIGSLFQNGNLVAGQTTSTIAPGNDQLVDRIGLGWNSAVYIDGSIPVVRIYNRALTTTEITQNYNALLPRFANTPTNQITITTTESVTASSSIYYAALGTGDKRFALSNPTTGISIDTATVNTVRLNVANTLTATSATVARSVTQVITATDTTGLAAATPVYVTTVVNPKIVITDATPGTISTTFGRAVVDTYTATYGTGNKTFTGVSSAFPSAFTVTNPLTNVGVLTVANNLPVGTYTETITATDTVGATTIYVLTIVVNPAPTIAGSPSNNLATTLGRATSLRVNVIGGSGNRIITWTSPAAGITIDTSTVAAQNYLTLNVSSAVLLKSYSFTLTVTDSMSVRASETFTVIVNRWPRITDPALISSGLRLNLDPSTYSGSGTWLDSSGNGFNAVPASASTNPTGTGPTFISESDGYFRYGTSNQSLQAASVGSMETFTVSAWVRVSQTNHTGNPALVAEYSSGNVNFLIQLFNGRIIGSYRTGGVWIPTEPGFVPDLNVWMYVTYVVIKNSPGNYSNLIYKNGVLQQTAASTAQPSGNSGIVIIGRRWDATASTVAGEIGAVNIYNRSLSAAEILENYNAQGSRFFATNSGSESVSVTQGVAGSITGVTATQGTGTKTFVISNSNAGITVDTSTANAFTLNLANTLTSTSATVARTLTETVTATDAASATTSRIYTITVNPPIRIESTTSIITTTSGIVAWDTFTATQGTGAKTFTFTGTPSTSGFTLTQASNRAVLRVGATVNPGTYTLTITATDAVGAVTTLTKTVVVNNLPTISGNTSFAGTRGYTFNSPSFTAAGGTGNLIFSISSVPTLAGGVTSGIRLSATSGTPTIIVDSTTAVDTYTVTLRITDSVTAFSTFIVTLRVNPPVTLTGSLSLSKVYGEELSQVYTTSGGTAPFNILASTVCTSEKSTYVGNGTNGTLGVTYTVEKFNGVGSCNWSVPKDVSSVSVLTVAGGGGGGGTAWAGGGGAGGVVFANSVSVTSGAAIPIAVGAGGAGGVNNDTCISGSSPSQGSNGNNSSFNATFTAVGGGGGGGYGWSNRAGCGSGKSGGSGGGAGETDYNPVVATSTQGTFAGATSSGNSGGVTVFLSGIQAGSGGGGAGGIGGSTASSQNHVAGNGGAGIAYSITGTSTFYGGGGGGATCISGCRAGAAVGTGGSGGGGSGGHGGASPVNGTDGLGGGGGGSQTGLGAKGGSGTVVVRYVTPAVDTETTRITLDTLSVTPTGSLRLNAPRNLPVGTYTQSITVKDSASTPATTSATVTLTVTKATPTVTLSLPGSVTTAKYGSPVIVSAIATTAGNIAFVNGSSNITACTAVATTAGLATCSWTPTVVGATTLKATLTPTDSTNYNNSLEASLAITVSKADTLTVTVTSQTLTYTGSAALVTGAFTTTGLVAIDTLTAISMLYSGTANTGTARSAITGPTDAGTYTIAPNFPANANAYTFGVGSLGTTSALTNYESVTVVAGTLTIARAPQVMTFSYPNSNTATYSPTGTITASATTRLDSAVRSYSSTTLTKCTIDSSTAVISIVEAGSCQVNMMVAQTSNYLADTATATVTINKASRTFTLTPAVSTLKYSESTTVTANVSAGALDGTISYTLGSPAGCTFDPLTGELVAISGTIQCPLTAIISEGINYRAETSTAMALTIARANAPLITIDTVTAMDHTPGIRALITPTFTVSGLKNTDTADSILLTYSFVSNPFETFSYSDTRTPIDAGTYAITPSALTLSTGLIGNYQTPNYASSAINFVINRINQESLTVENTNGEVEVPFTMKARGGSTSGTVSFTKISGDYCTVSGSLLSATQAGNCVVTVTMTGNRNYLPVTSETITVRVRNFINFQFAPPTGVVIKPIIPLVKDVEVCTTGCVPTITGSNIYEGAEADLVLLYGTNFLGVTKVYFNIYLEAPNFVADSDTQISVRVPADLPVGDATIEVVSPGGTSNRYFDFYILP
jgi:uncharacterized repeat protein (TIGR02543 family)